MDIDFYKYQGAGNDFIIIDNRSSIFPKTNNKLIQFYCDRKFGIGADGLMLLDNSEKGDFKMEYFNADGNPGSMCGNGGRCMVAFASYLGLFDKNTSFEAIGEMYEGSLEKNQVSLKMIDVDTIETHKDHVFMDTGSPHHVAFSDDISNMNVIELGRKIRYGSPYYETGTNVNFVQKIDSNTFKVRTYERGVENETLSCGTGVTAVALAAHHLSKTKEKKIHINTLGGELKIEFDKDGTTYKNIVLTGPATFVFKGSIAL